MPTTPDLDSETERLKPEDAVDRISNLSKQKGLYVVSFESGFGEYYDFIRRTAPIIAEPKPFNHFRGTNGMETEYPLGSVVSILRSDQVQDIYLSPLERMPKWGDGSIHYSCSSCYKPVITDEMDLNRGKVYHEECLDRIRDS